MRVDADASGRSEGLGFDYVGHLRPHAGQVHHILRRRGYVAAVLLGENVARLLDVLRLVVVKAHLSNQFVEVLVRRVPNVPHRQAMTLESPHGLPHHRVLRLAAEHEGYEDLETSDILALLALREGVSAVGVNGSGTVRPKLSHQLVHVFPSLRGVESSRLDALPLTARAYLFPRTLSADFALLLRRSAGDEIRRCLGVV
mmetsp:Transcript_46899/g.142078  ORF Transcript_46899/g.142078 Transcript_46899/m.142078 type:complete len:200 (-) Transcript_46899:322-921(-)